MTLWSKNLFSFNGNVLFYDLAVLKLAELFYGERGKSELYPPPTKTTFLNYGKKDGRSILGRKSEAKKCLKYFCSEPDVSSVSRSGSDL